MVQTTPTNKPVVGPGQGLPGGMPKVPLTPSTPVIPGQKSTSVIDTINNRLGIKDVKIDTKLVGSMSYVDALTDDQLTMIGKILKIQGYTVKANRNFIKNLMTKDDPTLQAYVNSASNYNELIAALQQGTLGGLAKGASTGAANYDNRSIRKVNNTTINSIIDSVSQSVLRKDITDPNERKALVEKIKKQFEEGTLTSTKKVKNPKTGKWEVQTVTSGPSSEDIQLGLTADLKKSHAEDYQLNQALGFNDFLAKTMSRGM
jgi:hypothetical protein